MRTPSRLTALRAAVARIGTTLDEDATCAELAREAVRQVGGTAAVLRIAVDAGTGYEAVHGDSALLPDVRWAVAAAREASALGEAADPIPYVASDGGRAALGVPLATSGQSYGALVCARDRAAFTPAEAALLAVLAERAASHIRQAREHERVRGIVGDLQRALLAEPGRPHPNLDVAIRYLPVGQSALVGGDVMGHGLEAAVDMTAYRSALRSIASARPPASSHASTPTAAR